MSKAETEVQKRMLRRDLIHFAFENGGIVDTARAARKLGVTKNLATRTMKALVDEGYFAIKNGLFTVVR